MQVRRRNAVGVGLVCFAVVLGCSARQRARTETAVADVLISDQQEEQLGTQVHQQLEREGIQYLQDPVVTGYVEGIVLRLLPPAREDRRNLKVHVHVIDAPTTVNAFATPGGHLYVASGLIASVDTEAELAGVLGHEMGHVVARHAARQLVAAYGLDAVLSLAVGKNPTLLEKVGATLVGQGTLLAHGRGAELESDEYAARYTSAVGYDPRGIVTFFTKLMAQQGRTPRVLSWLSTHPATTDRIERVNELIAEERLTGTFLGAEQLAPIKRRVAGGQPVSRR